MGFFDWLFGKKKKSKYEIDDSDGQEQYFKSDFDEVKKSAPKKATKAESAEPKKEEKSPQEKPEVQEKPKAKKESKEAKKTENKAADPKEEKVADPLPTTEIKEKKSGRFEIKKAKDGRFVFNLYAPNHVIVATSQVYSSSSSAVNGIQSIIANAERAPLEDNTLKNPTKQPFPKWEMYIDKGGQYRFRLYATNGNCVVHSQGYTAKASCKNGIDSIIRCAKNAEIDKSYLKNSKL